MGEIKVLSRTQKIIVDSPSSVRVVSAGPMGPPGITGPPGPAGNIENSGAKDNVETPINPWTMIHNLGFKPAGWQFFTGQNCTGDQMDPESINDINNMVSTATWLEATPGSWKAS